MLDFRKKTFLAYERHLKLTLTFSATKALFDKYSEIGANHIIRSQLPNYANISSEAITCSSMGARVAGLQACRRFCCNETDAVVLCDTDAAVPCGTDTAMPCDTDAAVPCDADAAVTFCRL